MAIDNFDDLVTDKEVSNIPSTMPIHYPDMFHDNDGKKKKQKKKWRKKMKKMKQKMKKKLKKKLHEKICKKKKRKLSKERKIELDKQMQQISWDNGYLTSQNKHLKEKNDIMRMIINVGISASKGKFDEQLSTVTQCLIGSGKESTTSP